MKPKRARPAPVWNGETTFVLEMDEQAVRALAAGSVTQEIQEAAANMLDLQTAHTVALKEPA